MTLEPENEQPSGELIAASPDPLPHSAFKNVICPKCGKRMLLEVGPEPRNHRCPVCRLAFQTTWEHDVLAVNFAED